MTGFQPLAVIAGQIENVGDRRTEILKLNLGSPDIQNITGDFDFQRTMTFVRGIGGIVNVLNITGGADGDLLIIGGRDVRLVDALGNLNLLANYLLQPGKTMMLYYFNGAWEELNRSP
jgi:hypothetical protein